MTRDANRDTAVLGAALAAATDWVTLVVAAGLGRAADAGAGRLEAAGNDCAYAAAGG